MALTASEEALVRQLLDQQAAILSLAGNEATITSKLGATKVTLSDLTAASSLSANDLLLVRQGTTDKSSTASLLKNLVNTFQQSGIGAVERTNQDKLREVISVKDFGATGNGVTDDTASIQDAITAAAGKALYFPGGTYIVTALTVTTEVELFGDGYSRSQLKLKNASNTVPLLINGASHFVMRDMSVDGNKANNPTGTWCVQLSGTCTGPVFDRVFFVNAKTDGLGQGGTVDHMIVRDCIAETCGNDGFSIATATSSLITGNRSVLNGRFGIVVTANYNRVIGNTCHGNTSTGIAFVGAQYCVAANNSCFSNTGHGLQFNNCKYSTQSGNVCHSNGISGLDMTLGCDSCVCTGNTSILNTVRGIEIDSGSFQCAVIGNIVTTNGEVGISVYRSPSTLVEGNQVLNNGNSASPKYGIRLWDDVGTLPSSTCVVTGNYCGDNRGASATQTHGLGMDANTAGTVISQNNFANNVTAPIALGAAGNIQAARDNLGYITQNKGSGFFNAGDTAIVINHGLSVTPAATDFKVVFTNAPAVAIGEMYIDTVTATQATVHIRTAPGGAGLGFGWSVSKYP